MVVDLRIKDHLEEHGVVVLLGMYGVGKSKVVKDLIDEYQSLGNTVVRIDCRGLPMAEEGDVPEMLGGNSWAQLHSSWRDMAERAHKKGQKLYIVIDEVQKFIRGGKRLWEIFDILLYYHRSSVAIILVATPSLVDEVDPMLRKIMRGNVIWKRDMGSQELKDIIIDHEKMLNYPLMKYKSAILRLSHGHYGTVKYICQLIAENRYDGRNLSETRVIKWAKNRGDIEYFLNEVWSGFSQRQQLLIKKWLMSRGRLSLKEPGMRVLIDSGLLYLGGREVKWRIDWILGMVRDFVSGITLDFEINDVLWSELGTKERVVAKLLVEKKGSVVNYDQLMDKLAGESGEYGMWALSRLVGRVREKIRLLAPSVCILNVRGVGYKCM